MLFKNKKLRYTGVGGLLLLVLVLILADRVWDQAEPFYIGAIIPVTTVGEKPFHMGQSVQQGITLAVSQVNKWGGINGREVRVIFQDPGLNQDKARASFKWLESQYRPELYISILSPITASITGLAEESQVPLFGLVATAPQITEGKRWTFRYWTSAGNDIKSYLPLFKKLDLSSLGLVYLDDEYGMSIFKTLGRELEPLKIELVVEAFRSSNADPRVPLKKLMGTEGILIIGYPEHITTISGQIKASGYKGLILTNNSVALPSIRELSEMEGVLGATFIIYNPNVLFINQVNQAYQSHYQKPLNAFAAIGYDVIKLISGLLEEQEVSRREIRDLLEAGFIFPGLFGEIAVSPGSHDIDLPLHLVRIEGGEVRYLKKNDSVFERLNLSKR